MAAAQRLSSLSIFFPAYNDAGTIGRLVADALQTGSLVADEVEVLVVNDGSHDDTREILESLCRQDARVRVIHHPHNRGYGGALRTGFSHATKAWVFYTDGDGQYDVAELQLLAAQLAPEVDMVNGYKVSRSDPWYRIWLGKAYNRTVCLLFGITIRDVDCDFRLMRTPMLAGLGLKSDSGAICVELVCKMQNAGARIREVAVSHYPRQYGKSQFFSLRQITALLVHLPVLWVELIVCPKKAGL